MTSPAHVLTLARMAWDDPPQATRFLRNRAATLRYHIPGIVTAAPPTVVYLAVNSSCNLRCRMCDVGLGEKDTPFHDKLAGAHRDMTTDEFRAIADSMHDVSPLFSLTSTEPLLWKNLWPALEHLARLDMHASITTNGYLLPRMAVDLVRAGLRSISVSLDGPPRIHNTIRGVKDSFQKAMEGIAALQEEKRRTGRTAPHLTVNCTITADNHEHISALMPHLRSIRPDMTTFSHMNFVTERQAHVHNTLYARLGTSRPMCIAGVNPFNVNPQVLARQLATIRREAGDLPIFITPNITSEKDITAYYRDPFVRFGHRTCLVPWKHAQILADGRVTVLTRCFDISFGNVFETPLPLIWNGEAMRNFRAELKKHGWFPACLRCCGMF